MINDNIEIMTTYTGQEAPKVVNKKIGNKFYTYVPFITDESDGVYTWQYVMMQSHNYNYAGLISAIICLKYNNEEELAILNNYLAEPKNTKYKKEFADLQSWRTTAKDYAKKHFNIN